MNCQTRSKVELNKFGRQLQLLEMLIGNQHLTIEDISEKLELSTRSVYRYIKFFEDSGFDVYNEQGVVAVGLTSPFVAALTRKVHFTSDELGFLGLLLSQADDNSPLVHRLRTKLRNIYGLEFDSDKLKFNKNLSANILDLQNSIKKRRQCVLQKYNSLNSGQTSDRLVEPFQFLNDKNEVRCYEITSGQCKTFKVARIGGRVLVKDERWAFTMKHVSYMTDVFGFAGEKVWKVILRLTNLSKTILVEEFGVDESKFVIEDGTHFLITLPVCNMKGVGRFVMGLINDVEIVKGDALRKYVNEQLLRHLALLPQDK